MSDGRGRSRRYYYVLQRWTNAMEMDVLLLVLGDNDDDAGVQLFRGGRNNVSYMEAL